MHGQGEVGGGRRFGRREVAGLVAQVRERRLKVQRRRVVGGAGHAGGLEGGGDFVAPLAARHVEVVDVSKALGHGRAAHVGRQAGVVPGRHLGAPRVPAVDPGEADPQHRRLDLVEARVEADVVEVHLVAAAVEAQQAGHLDELGDAAGHQATVAVAAQALGREEAEDGEVAKAAGAAPLVARAERLAGVFDDHQAVLAGDRAHGVGVGRQAEQVDRHDGLGHGRDGAGDGRGVDVQRIGVDVDEDRARAGLHDRFGGRIEGEGRGDDLVALAHAGRLQGDRQAIGAVSHADRGVGRQILGDLGLERFHVGPQNELSAAHDVEDGGLDFVAHVGDLPLDVHQTDRHVTRLP